MHYRKIELIMPVFTGCLCSLILCALLMVRQPDAHDCTAENQEMYNTAAEENFVEAELTYFFAQVGAERRDLILELFRDPEAQGRVIGFFAEICASPEIAEVILVNAESYNISPALAAALAWEESRLNPRAVNTKNQDESIDRGLFQLNNRSFPRLEIQSFFNPKVNAKHGMSHLRYCLDAGGSEIAALAMYNAGANRVRHSGTPKSTLDYVNRIMENRRNIEDLFREREARFQNRIIDNVIIPEIAEVKPEHSRLFPLMPLAGK